MTTLKINRHPLLTVLSFFVLPLAILQVTSCASSMKVGQHNYGDKKSEWTIKNDFPQVWKGIEEAVRQHKISKRNPKEADEVKMRTLKERNLETDWIYSRSNDKFVEFKVNGFPEKKYLQTRVKYKVIASRSLGGTTVKVEVQEEIENLKSDGSPNGYSSAQADPALAHGMLEKIKTAVMAMPDLSRHFFLNGDRAVAKGSEAEALYCNFIWQSPALVERPWMCQTQTAFLNP